MHIFGQTFSAGEMFGTGTVNLKPYSLQKNLLLYSHAVASHTRHLLPFVSLDAQKEFARVFRRTLDGLNFHSFVFRPFASFRCGLFLLLLAFVF